LEQSNKTGLNSEDNTANSNGLAIGRCQRTQQERIERSDWKQDSFQIPYINNQDVYGKTIFDKEASLLDIFMFFVSPDLLAMTWASRPADHWYVRHGQGGWFLGGGRLNMRLFYAYFAVYILITGRQNAPKESMTGLRFLRENIRSSLSHFEGVVGPGKLPGYTTIEAAWCRLYILRYLWDFIAKRFQEAVKYPGVSIAGDEKLFHYTGHSAYVRLVPSKPDRIGLWFYELCCMLHGRQPYLLDFLLQDSLNSLNISIPVQTITYRWGSIVKHFQNAESQYFPLLVFDSYYLDKAGMLSLRERGISYIASAQSNRVGQLIDQQIALGQTVSTPGETGAIWNDSTRELFVHHWSANTDIAFRNTSFRIRHFECIC
jgi:hypothetical protein